MNITSIAKFGITVVCGAVATIASAADDPLNGANGPRPAQWPPGVSEWNAPQDIYVEGDPLLLTRDNMQSGKRINFVACPYLRDSEPTPLWYADYNGETYFLRAQQNMTAAVHHPDLLHKVLVEGIVSDHPRIGGGIVLTPLTLSTMPELDPTCNKELPADGTRISFAKRPPGPGSDGRTRDLVQGTAAQTGLFERLWAVNYTPDPVKERVVKEVRIPFEFDDSEVVPYLSVVHAVKYARDVSARKIEIRAGWASVRLSNGKTLVERNGIARERARSVERIVRDFQLGNTVVDVSFDTKPRAADGISDFANRFATIVITPGDLPATQANVR